MSFPSVFVSHLCIATWQTIYMVFIAGLLGLSGGLLLGGCLYHTSPHGMWHHKTLYRYLSLIVNIGRSVPFIILMVAILPFTRLLIGTTIGINAAVVPLVVAAIPFYARIAESALLNVPHGIKEAALAMGANTWQLMLKFILPEALPALIQGATLTIIGLVGYSAMAGAVGGGGLGELAINYGYQRFDWRVMLATVVLLVILVQLIQVYGTHLAKRPKLKPVLIVSLVFAGLCFLSQVWPAPGGAVNVLRVGIMSGTQEKIMQVAKQFAWRKYHVRLDLITFDNYVLPNTALNNGDIDANIFQHIPYLDAQIKARHYQLTPIAKTFIYPLGFYSKRYHSLSEIPEYSKIAIPNDPSNEGRALLLLQKAGLIKLRAHVGFTATLDDIAQNPSHFKFITMDAAQIPRALSDVAMGALTNDFVRPAGLHFKRALLKEGPDSPYANVIVVRSKEAHDPRFIPLVKAMHSKPVIAATEKLFPNGAALPAWNKS